MSLYCRLFLVFPSPVSISRIPPPCLDTTCLKRNTLASQHEVNVFVRQSKWTTLRQDHSLDV